MVTPGPLGLLWVFILVPGLLYEKKQEDKQGKMAPADYFSSVSIPLGPSCVQLGGL